MTSPPLKLGQPRLTRTATTMADGRELIYYDERPLVHSGHDRRDLPPRPPTPELRHDPLTDEWIAIAAHRQARTFLPPADECPLCPFTPERDTEIPDEYDVAVFENRFPSYRRCEVVCFTSEHQSSFAQLSPQRARTVMEVWADRTAALSTMDGVEHVFCFENRGVEIGVTLHHPHGQIYGYPFVPPRTLTMLRAARRYADGTGGLLGADVLAAERAARVRVVAANEHWTAYVPAAARWPFEVHVVPHRHVLNLPGLSDAEVAAFGPVYLDVLRRCDRLFGAPMPYISAWHQAPVRHPDRDLAYLHLQLTSPRRAAAKLKYLAGSEAAMGAFVNDVRPEQAAALLREVQR
jgi:UDPglucose--hexose-1-phosphate uridylyltransferase